MINTNELYREGTHCLCSELEIEKALSSCLTLLRQYIPADHLGAQIFEPSLGSMRMLAVANDASSQKFDTLIPISSLGKSLLGDEGPPTDGPLVINQPAENAICSTMVTAMGMDPSAVSIIVMQVLTGRQLMTGEDWGSVAVMANRPNAFTQEHADVLAVLADPFGIAIANALHYRQVLSLTSLLSDENKFLRKELQGGGAQEVIGAHFGLAQVMQSVRQVAKHDSPVLLLGETGVGKDVIANQLHQLSARHDGPMIKINCGAIPESLIDSELFGYEKGAFTGALATKRGRFERADGGTVFLDEIGELPPAAQVRLLRVLQNKEIERVGGNETIRVDLRVVAATNRDLREMVANGQFREDLWFRINVFPITIPSLRERRQDIPALLEYAIKRKSLELKIGAPARLAPGTIEQLVAYDWPGNVRELENVVERELVTSNGEQLTFSHMAIRPATADQRSPPEQSVSVRTLDEVAIDHIRQVLANVNGKIHGQGGAAQLLGINESTLRNRMKKLGIAHPRERTRKKS